ncbi:MAG: HAD family hydrolase [Thomasclavelia sp.]|jgi:HAD superfamily hydrolase (TIGR01484 family)|nr:HAD family hydrolase [Thomasclavelia sp.]
MKKILFSDIDGTLYHDGKVAHENDSKYISKLHQNGYYFALCTGRNLSELGPIKENFDYDFLVLNNGATIMDKNDNILFEKKIPGDIGREIMDYLLNTFPSNVNCFQDGKDNYILINNKTYSFTGHSLEEKEYDFYHHLKNSPDFEILNSYNLDESMENVLTAQSYIEQNYGDYAHGILNKHYLCYSLWLQQR